MAVKRVRTPEQQERRLRLDRESRARRRTKDSLLIPEDGIIDRVAIAVAASGVRLVRLTPTERDLAARAIIAAGGGVPELAANLGLNTNQAAALARSLGYRVTRNPHSGTSLIVAADNSRLGPGREGHGHASTCMCETRRDAA